LLPRARGTRYGSPPVARRRVATAAGRCARFGPGFLQQFPRGIELVGAQQHAGTVGECLGGLQPVTGIQGKFRALLVAAERLVVLALRDLEVREVVQVQGGDLGPLGLDGHHDAPRQVLARTFRLLERDVGIAEAGKRLRDAGLVFGFLRRRQQLVECCDRAFVVTTRLLCLRQAAQRLVPRRRITGLGVHQARLLEVADRVVELPALQRARAFTAHRERRHEFLSWLAGNG
jgi:hypothetical protein